MCQCVYIGTDRLLPEIVFDRNLPGFYVEAVPEQDPVHDRILNILHRRYLFAVGGWMGCGCSIGFDRDGLDLTDPEVIDEYNHAVADTHAFLRYIRAHATSTDLKVFCTWWEKFPETYESRTFVPEISTDDAFRLEECVIWRPTV